MAMIFNLWSVDTGLFRRGLNQFGGLSVLAGLVAFFVEPMTEGEILPFDGYGAHWLIAIGVLAFAVSLFRMKPKTGGTPPGGE